jgi:cell division protein FtsI (penicillin-binding protein 3)
MSGKPSKYCATRAILVGITFLLWMTALGVRAGYLQLYRGAWLTDKAQNQYTEELVIRAKRGTIYDTHHQPMAVSVETTSIAANPHAVEDKTAAAAKLAKVLKLKRQAVQRKLSSRKSFVWLKRQASPKQVAAIKKLKIDGIEFLPEHSRFYPNTTLGAQVLGFTGIDGHGLEGLEFFYDRELKGAEQRVTVLKDALGRGFDADQLSGMYRAGNNLVLTLDRHVQYIAEQVLAKTVAKHKARSGMVIVMVPESGALLALAHYPFFNPNAFGQYHRDTWRNRAITDPYEPGSTMKIFSAAAALESGASTANTIFYCENGTYPIGAHTIHDTKSYGWLSLQQIVKYSSNIGAVKVVEKVGPQTLYEYLQGFGFGSRTEIDCPGESVGTLSHFKRWTAVDTGAIAFGQGVSVTGLQLICAVSTLANNGMMMRPHIVQAVTDHNGRLLRTIEPTAQRQIISAKTARTVRRIMRTVITEGGTGTMADLEGYAVCGKTGTAQKIDQNGKYAQDKYVSSFVGFAPTERPALAALVVIDEPQGTFYGGLVAAPAFKEIVEQTLGYLNIAPAGGRQKLRVSRDASGNG